MPRERSLPKSPTCRAKSSRTGQPCKKYAVLGAKVCLTHGGSAPQVRRKAAQRVRDMLADVADPDRVMREAGRIAFSDIRELYGSDGKILPIAYWPEDIARAVKSIETIRGNVDKGDGKYDEVVRITLWDKPRPVQDLMKHHGLLADKLEVTGDADLLARLEAGRQRLRKQK